MKADPRVTLLLRDVLRAIMRPLLLLRCPVCASSGVVTPEHIEERANNGVMAMHAEFRIRAAAEPTDPMRRTVRKSRE